ncbi:helix-turn-helix domain-containing protein [Pseudoclavibacter chungangensis]|uniref:Helix-turn-helix domain-containing protein n=1 Tax=Pseudoclavibacter chungangensis TaxID=587635 RepID=A0A7J5BPU7_9MICO|nr:helix-turn-helix domain-containing protein [Pseudoclavibacter chungangensis]KAB1655374.1 helix-turn-helix domain-containing protein [Pseudoclavibacter chungangensis]NYJ68325.1 AraC-like DNA-binding protein/quercetin dioxygenase-like cupin family protein [Pseudoclavibacter chungangensis]
MIHTTHRSTEAPSILAMRVGPLVEEQHAVLLWVHTGSASFDAGGLHVVLGEGCALWVPPGVEHRTGTEAGSVVFPFLLRLDALPGVLGVVHIVHVPPGWGDWLVHRWDDNSYTSDALPDADLLLRLVAHPNASASPKAGYPDALPMPRSREALAVARTLLDDPTITHDLARFAARERVSAKTLQRQFHRETGTTFALWRRRARIGLAVRRLSQGHPVAPTGREIGYRTTAGFSRAFRRVVGVPPREFRSGVAHADAVHARVGSVSTSPTPRHDAPARRVPRIPARTFWGTVGDRHELMWVFRGTVVLRIGRERRTLRRGQALWVSAGVAHDAEFEAGAVMLTVGRLPGHLPVENRMVDVVEFPDEYESFLLHTMLAEFSLFRPDRGRGAFVRELFHRTFPVAGREPRELGGVIGDIAATLRRDPSDARSLAAWADRFGTSATELGAAFVSRTGESFPRWRARIRMDVARERLQHGRAPGTLHTELGYSSQAVFTRAFTAAHGISPGAYQRRESRWLEVPASEH